MDDLLGDDIFIGAFDSDDDETPESSKSRLEEQNLEFWRLLQRDRDKIQDINGAGELAGGARGIGEGASIAVKAKKLGEGNWQLSKELPGNGQKAYLLNYVAGQVTCVARADYEADHDFFLTVALSGCRFTLTTTHVLHIAADAGVGAEGRDRAETSKLAGLNIVPVRKRSVSVTRRPGSILYFPMPSAALADIAQTQALSAMHGNMQADTNEIQIALAVADKVRSLSPSEETIDKAVVQLRAAIIGKVTAAPLVEQICAAFRAATVSKVVDACKIIRGAFVVGVKVDAAWTYHVLANGVWAEVLPG